MYTMFEKVVTICLYNTVRKDNVRAFMLAVTRVLSCSVFVHVRLSQTRNLMVVHNPGLLRC